MIKSRYNFTLYCNGFGYWYNTRTNSYFRLNESTSKKLESILSFPDNIDSLTNELRTKLSTGGFIIEDTFDEIADIRAKHLNVVNSKDYFLVILPTLNCNYSCWYCIQEHKPSLMNELTRSAIKRHIEYMIKEQHISSLHLSWFGGEPFMFFKQIIEPISEYAIDICKKNNVPFKNTSTTNGYFLTQDVCKKLEALKFKSFQITLDGNKEFHDKVKFTHNCESTFEYVLHNINNILATSSQIYINLRINYTHKNLTTDIVNQVNSFIEHKYRNRVIISPKKVWQETIDRSYNSILNEILSKFEDSGYKVSRYDFSRNYIPCYVNKKFYNAINYNGRVLKCTACQDLNDNKNTGELLENGTITWKNDFEKKCVQPTFENEKCLSCKRLPLCMGICPRDFINGSTFCKYDNIDQVFEVSLLDFLVRNC